MPKKLENLTLFILICFICPFILVYGIYYVMNNIMPLLGYRPVVNLVLWFIIFLMFWTLIHLDKYYVHIISIICFITMVIELKTFTLDLSKTNTENYRMLISLMVSNIMTAILLIFGFTYIKSRFKNHKNLGGFFILGLMQTSICMLFPNYIAPEPHKNYKEQIIIIHWIMNMEYLILPALYIYETTRPFIKGRNSYKVIKWLLKEMKKSSS